MLVKRLKDLNAPLQEILGRQNYVRQSTLYTFSFSHSLTHEDDDEDSRWISRSFAFVLFKRDGDGTRARTTNDPRFTHSVPSSSSHSLSLVTSWDDDHHRHHHHLGEQTNDTALSLAAFQGKPKCVELLLRHMTKEDVLKTDYVRPLSLAPFVLIPRSALIRLHLRLPLATQSISSYLSLRSLHARVSQTLSLSLYFPVGTC